jgi:hypothetical protein
MAALSSLYARAPQRQHATGDPEEVDREGAAEGLDLKPVVVKIPDPTMFETTNDGGGDGCTDERWRSVEAPPEVYIAERRDGLDDAQPETLPARRAIRSPSRPRRSRRAARGSAASLGATMRRMHRLAGAAARPA